MTSTLTSKKPIKRNSGFSVTLTGESPISNQLSGFSVTRTSEKPLGGKYILDKMSDPHYMPTEEEYYAYIKAEEERPKESAITLIKSGIDTAASDLGGMFSGAYDLMLKGEFGEGFKAIGEAAARGTADIGQLARKIVYDNVQYALGDDSSDYEVFLATRKLQSIREKAREGDAGLLFDLTPEANKVAEGLSYITDPSVFVPGAGLVSKATSKVAGGATRLAGKAIGGTGRAGMIAADKVGDIAQRVAPDVSPSDIPRAGLVTSAIQTGRTAPQILDTAGRTLEQASTYIGKQPTRMGVLRSISEDISVPTDIRKFAGMIRFMDTPLAVGGTLGRGAVEGAAIGSVLGGLAEGREGFYSGLGAGGFMGTGAAGLGGAVSKVSGFRRKQAVSREFADYIARKPKEEQENLAKYVGNDHNSMARVMDLERFAIGATGKDMSFRFLDQQQFREELAARESMRLGRKVSPEEVQPARGVQIDDTSPTILINTSHNFNKGRTMAHEIFHGLSKLESMKDFTDRLTDNLFGMYDSAGNLIKDGILLGKGKTKKDRNALTFELGRQYAKLLKSKNDRADFFGADKSTPKEQAEQFRKNLAAEIGAEYFAGLLAGSSPDALLPKNIDSMSRAALDRVMLADAESKLGALRKILNRGFGDIWKWDKATGKPTAGDIFSKDGKPITNSPEINALLRDMVRAKKKVSAKLEYADKSNGNTAAPRNLGQDEIKRLIDLNPAMADIFTLTPKGKYVPRDDVAIAADEQRRSDAIVDALDKAPKGTGAGATGGVRVVAEGEYSGMKFNPDQIEALLEIPELNDHVKTHLREINDKIGEGDVLEIDYYAATRKARRINRQTGKPYYISKYSTRIRMSRRKVVPYHMNISKAGNFHVKALDLTQLGNKIDKWGKDKNKKNWIKEWKNTDELYTDLSRYLTNLTKPEGERVPSASLFGETKRNILNELLGSRRKELVNPLQLLEYAEKDNLIRDFRLDRINQMRWETFMGKEWKMSEDNYQLQKMNYLPANLQPENLDVNTPRLSKEQEANIKEVQGHYDKVTPQRVKELKREALESLSVRIEELGIPKKEAKQLAQKAYKTISTNTKRTSAVVSGIGKLDLARMAGTSTKKGGFPMRSHINKSWLTSAFEAIEKDSDVAAMKAQQVAKQLSARELDDMMKGIDSDAQVASGERSATMKLGEEFRDRESLADEKAFGSSLRKDVNAPPRVYASVGDGQKFLSQGNYDAFFTWKKTSPIVVTSHHHYGVGNGLTNIHASKNVGDKNARSFGDPTNEKYTKLKSGKKILDTHLLVGNKGIDAAKAHQLMVSLPASALKDVKRAYKKDGVNAAWKELEKAAYKQNMGQGSQGRSKSFTYTTKQGDVIPPLVAVQSNRTEAYILDPSFKNVESVTIVASKEKNVRLLKNKIEGAFKANGVKLPKVNIVYPESGPSPHRGRQKLAKEYEQLTGEVTYMPEVETVRTVDQLVEAARSEKDWRTWYQRYSNQLNTLFGVSGAKTFEKILGATSQATGVAGNVTLALRAYTQMITGQPFEGFLEGVKNNLERIRNEEMVQGQKIGEFARAATGDESGVAIDRHVARIIFGRENLQGGSTPSARQVKRGKIIVNQVAKKLGWKPREVQAALWAAQIELDARARGVEPKKESYDTYLDNVYRSKRGKSTVAEIIKGARAVERGDAELVSGTLGSTGKGKSKRPDRSGIIIREQGNERTIKFMPESETTLGNSTIRESNDGYRTIKRDGKTRVYSPRGKLIGVASSEKVADKIYRRHSRNGTRTVSVR